MKLIWSPLVEKNTLFEIRQNLQLWQKNSNVSLQKIQDFRVFICIFAFRKCLLLILHFENRQFDPKKGEYFSVVICTESRKSRSKNLARFNLALKFDICEISATLGQMNFVFVNHSSFEFYLYGGSFHRSILKLFLFVASLEVTLCLSHISWKKFVTYIPNLHGFGKKMYTLCYGCHVCFQM